MSLAWKKHRMRCVKPSCPRRTWVLDDHRIAAKNCLLTTRAAASGPRSRSAEAAPSQRWRPKFLACDWHTVNDAVITYGEALLAADRKRLNKTTAIGLDETSFVKLSDHVQTHFATTVADVENHQIIDILPTRKYIDVAGWIDKQPRGWKGADPLRSRRVGHILDDLVVIAQACHVARGLAARTTLSRLVSHRQPAGLDAAGAPKSSTTAADRHIGWPNVELYRIRALLRPADRAAAVRADRSPVSPRPGQIRRPAQLG